MGHPTWRKGVGRGSWVDRGITRSTAECRDGGFVGPPAIDVARSVFDRASIDLKSATRSRGSQISPASPARNCLAPAPLVMDRSGGDGGERLIRAAALRTAACEIGAPRVEQAGTDAVCSH